MSALTWTQQIPHMLNDLAKWNPLPPKRDYLTGLDNIFLAAEKDEILMQVAGVYVFQKRIDPALVKVQIEDYCRQTGGRYMQRIVRNEWFFGRPYFEDVGDDFNIDELFDYVKLESPGSDEQIAEVAGREQSRGYDYRQPLMRCTYVDGVDGGKKFALVWRAHHALADGQGFTRALISYMATLDPVTGLPSPAAKAASAEKLRSMQFKAGRRKSVAERVQSFTERAWDTLWMVYSMVLGILLYVANMLWITVGATGLKGRKSLWHPDPAKRSGIVAKQVGWTSGLSLAEVKRVKNAMGCTLNDLLLAAAAGGMQRYCADKGQLADRNFVMLVPTSLRRSADFAISNESAGYMLTLPVSIDDPATRVKTIASRMNLLKKSSEPVGVYVGGKYGFTFPWLLPKSVMFANSHRVHGAITNVPGPAQPLMWGGVAIERLIPVIPCVPNGLGLAIESYADHVSIGCNMDLDASLPAGAFYAPGTAMGLCRAVEDEFRRIAAVADGAQREQVRELVAKLGRENVARELEKLGQQGNGKAGQ